ncbi:MAG: hypothetical protein A3E01_03050 [Gammaproteobacteria bacterium RIFCSPHIGHO2_12_FULL_63_22]|nr:MAG: hypothetical protein A3E01_03050 [Gammaproteobacteria bacterium RIFCSPHIGHO2_12_FULL_63_22]
MTSRTLAAVCLLLIVLLQFGTVGGLLHSSPVPGEGLHVAILWESGNRGEIPPGQLDAIFSTEVDDLIKASGGAKFLMDVATDQRSESDEWARRAFAIPHPSLPMIVIDRNGRGEAGPVPTTVDGMKKLVGKYAK